jgi:hypothetical protein
MELLQARPRRRGQTLRGLIRVNLAFIEQEVECGIGFATVRAQLGLSRVAPAAFRDALYNVRRRVRAVHSPVAATPRPVASARTTGVAPQSPATPMSDPTGVYPRHESLRVPRPKPRSVWGSNVRSPREFLDLVRSTDDSEIL